MPTICTQICIELLKFNISLIRCDITKIIISAFNLGWFIQKESIHYKQFIKTHYHTFMKCKKFPVSTQQILVGSLLCHFSSIWNGKSNITLRTRLMVSDGFKALGSKIHWGRGFNTYVSNHFALLVHRLL